MKPSSPNKLNAQIYDEASEWFVEFRTGDVDITNRKAFIVWLRTSPEHMRAYLEVAAIWNEGSHLDPNHRFDAPELAEHSLTETNIISFDPMSDLPPPIAVTNAENRDSVSPHEVSAAPHLLVRHEREGTIYSASSRDRREGRGRRPFAVAASVLVAIVGAWVYSERNTYSTGIGEQRTLTLADGSTIELNTHSKIRVRFAADRRTIDLIQGEALFHVAKDKARPFIVQSDDTKVRAVGTEFDVYLRQSGTTVTVLEGRVAVLPPLPTNDIIKPGPQQRRGSPASEPGPDPIVASSTEQSESAYRKAEDSKGDAPTSRSTFSRDKTHEDTRGSASTGVHPDGTGESRNVLFPVTGVRSGKGEPLPRDASPGDGPVANEGEFLLGAGEQAILTTQATVKPKQPNIAAATAWTQHRLVFNSATLADVAEEFNRYNQRRLVILSPELEDFHITGVFASTDSGSLMRFLQGRPGIVVTEKDDEILITRKL